MYRSNKKGFTIVELVVVIAVVAILAAVLIPTFAGLVRKANISTDTVLAKNLNTAAIAANADTFEDALAAVKEAGYLIANLNAKADECYFVWEDDSNQFLLYDLKEGKLVYANDEDAAGTADASWCFAIGDATVAAAVKAALPAITVKNTVVKGAAMNDIIANAPAGETVTIYIDESFTVTADDYLSFNKADADIVLDLAGSVVTSDYVNNASPYKTTAGDVTIQGGKINATTDAESWADSVSIVSGTGDDANVTVKDVQINVVAKPNLGKNVAILAKYGATVEVTDTTISAANGNAIQCYGATMVLDNVTVDQTGASEMGYYNSAIQVVNGYGENAAYDAHLTVNGGTYVGKVALQISLPGGTVIINDGKFVGTEAIHMDSNGTSYPDRAHSITINGGTFEGDIYAGTGSNILINGGTFTVDVRTVANVTIGEGKTVVENADGTYTVQ